MAGYVYHLHKEYNRDTQFNSVPEAELRVNNLAENIVYVFSTSP